jgi:tetratricopeptide (TPR) repeat protein
VSTAVGVSPAESIAELSARGELLRSRGRPFLAEPLLREALALTEQHFPHDCRRLAAALNAVGLLCKDLGSYDDARAWYDRALVVLESAGAANLADVATLYHNLGGIEHARGNFEALARKGLELRRESAPVDEHDLAADMIALGAILDGRERYDEAEPLYLEALAVLERDPDASGRELAVALNDLGANHARRGLLDSAETLLTRAIDLKTRRLGPAHPDVALSLNNLAFVHERRGSYRRARDTYEQAARIFERSIGREHPKTRDCRRNYERARALNSRM